MSNDLIAMDNSIVTSAYNLTLNEQRLIYCALKQMPKYDPKNPDQEPIDPKTPFYITRDDFLELGADPTSVAKEIRTATRELMKKTLYVQTPVGVKQFHWLSEVLRYDRNAEQKLRERYPNPSDYNKYINALRAYNLLDAITHKPDDNIVARVIFSSEIMPLLSDLRASFTQFLLSDIAEFSSIYSYRIYQLFMQYLNKETGKGWAQIDFYDLRFMLMLLDKYPLTADLKRWVLDVATKEINEKSPLKAKYELIKKGRKFVAVKFIFELKEKSKKTKETTEKDHKTVDIFDGFTELERQTIQERIDEHIKRLEAKGETVGDFHRKNIEQKAIAERWGLDVLAERERKKQAKEQERLARHEKELQEKQAQEYELQRSKERLERFASYFESLSDAEQQQALDAISNEFNNALGGIFKKYRQDNTAHKNVMFVAKFYEYFGFK